MFDPSTIQRFVQIVKSHLVGAVTLTGKVIAAFVAAVFAGLGAGLVLGLTLALITALGLAGIRIQPDDAGIVNDPATVIDITPTQA
jgi:hypothetical protein